ncbi:hypothetical protein [Methylocaldum sp.]|uniref:hypothetical protein n=1 Tax=Methylocaldum sp. TaxID=1969727 RepID=UPI002D503CC7|nr:hypothetical protein [Methylocaldum sp.]HYE35486.1 hypothetical protein [Methylocaldum sp.]
MDVIIKLRDDPLAENPDNVAVEVEFEPALSEQDTVSPAAALATRFVESIWQINDTARRHVLATTPGRKRHGH